MEDCIIINGTKHILVPSHIENDCYMCSLKHCCDRSDAAICEILFYRHDMHFEIKN